MPELVLLTTDGLHTPVMPLFDVVGKDGTVPPEQIVSDVQKVNPGVLFGVIVTDSVTGTAH